MTAVAHRQFGSKNRLAPAIVAMIPPKTRLWVEGFVGSGAVTLAKPRHRFEHINDKDGEIVNLFRCLRDPALCDRLCELVALTPYAQEEFANARLADDDGDPLERARCFLVRSWMSIGAPTRDKRLSWSAGWRSNSKANSPLPHVWARVPDRLQAVARRLIGVTIHCRDITEILDRFGGMPDACLFLDPPYPNHRIDTKAVMYGTDMTADEHEALALSLRTVAGAVILTMAMGTVYDDILHDWSRQTVKVQGLNNTIKDEVVFTNFTLPTDLFTNGG